MALDGSTWSTDSLRVSITDETREYLGALDGATVSLVATLGGVVDAVGVRDGALCRASSMVIRTDREYLVFSESVEIDGDEVFRVAVVEFDRAKHESHPSYGSVSDAAGLEIQGLGGSPIHVSVARGDPTNAVDPLGLWGMGHHPEGHTFPDDPENPLGPHFNDSNGGHHFYGN